jgi:hypothetical protein
VPQQCGPERRGRRDGAAAADRAHLDRDRLALLVLDLDDRADSDLVATRVVNDLRVVETCS